MEYAIHGLDVTETGISKSSTLGGSLDETGNVHQMQKGGVFRWWVPNLA
jgi:hypothetical protein